MFESLQEKLSRAFKTLSGKGRITESNIKEAVKQIKLSLLEADVNYKVVKEFIKSVQEKALGEEVLKSFTPDQQFIKIVRDELIKVLGEKKVGLNLSGSPAKIMLVGLQGSGKTTTSAKLALMLKKEGKHPLLVAADVYRPAAVDQLIQLGKQIEVPVYTGDRKDPLKIVQEALDEAVKNVHDVIIFDTAGRLHVDEKMMEEVRRIAEIVKPDEILMVIDAMTGQDAVNSAKKFNDELELTGFVVTKIDGDARGGVILSVRHVTGKPVKFVGISEKMDGLEYFYPDRIAGRILGMGDVLSLIDKLQASVDQEKAKKLEEKFAKNKFDLEDFLEQLREIKKLGSIGEILEMIPGAPKNVDFSAGEKSLKQTEAIISSMTREERRNPKIINYSRKQRIARGSGTSVTEVNKVLRSYDQMKQMMKKLNKAPKFMKKFKGFPF
ncbi:MULTISPECIES: signal recognition particle protein [Kosmotoga]|uniref:Signal recognition particle protein n=1 Tax=Kosmotoga olearia (strain ATCC BAA-1733 / DSM 21960 / TBF 19.5.1) TaxID=521045 RepID=C5CEB2_KOSOT|nr:MULTISPECIES: signal recognition particle protein [Kosmotoga]ACR80152.1 signal recognition particle protein [Kosmotoga olearia TBF 19.5.1]MDI3523713.1 signal recognition particle subunit [Kosmotoga sp.]MDK2953227.1 signal recognition particle subunit [Kosmotoga sp.]OAA20341.1 signal recognition particle [Kosmotoga sp. DU53]